MKYQQRNALSFVDNITYNEISAEEYTQLCRLSTKLSVFLY
jgi:hypothetical protein